MQTTSKEIVGAINEVNTQVEDIANKIENVVTYTPEDGDEDEYDEEERHIIKIGEDTYIVDGMTPLEELADTFSFVFDEALEVETLNGFVILHLKHIPDEKEQFSFVYQGYEFKIQSVAKRMIQKVRITKLPEKVEVEEKAE